ncbi:MAG TPA: hypothetical protein VK162_10110 [Streptosporangiaceae bacterium]|nr:hypothetical protein [Streptosporangiaceae bacterium]
MPVRWGLRSWPGQADCCRLPVRWWLRSCPGQPDRCRLPVRWWLPGWWLPGWLLPGWLRPGAVRRMVAGTVGRLAWLPARTEFIVIGRRAVGDREHSHRRRYRVRQGTPFGWPPDDARKERQHHGGTG